MECGALGKMDIIISDASAVLRNLPWPGTGGLVSDFINTVRQHVEKLLIDYDQVFFIFDRYNSDSIKGEERLVRSKGVTRTYVHCAQSGCGNACAEDSNLSN